MFNVHGERAGGGRQSDGLRFLGCWICVCFEGVGRLHSIIKAKYCQGEVEERSSIQRSRGYCVSSCHVD